MININIWDDYFEDGCVPGGEIQETYAYVESPDLDKADEKDCLEYLMLYIANNTLLANDIKMSLVFYDARDRFAHIDKVLPIFVLTRWDLRFEGLTHVARNKLIADLQQNCLSYKGEPMKIYSES